jgi:hypothetical protein
MARISPVVLVVYMAIVLMATASLHGDDKKQAYDQHVELMRGLTAEFATVKVMLPRSKKPLSFESTGDWDKKKWAQEMRTEGPAARAGDMVQVTKVEIGKDQITLQINSGFKKKGSFWDRVTIDAGGMSKGGTTNSGEPSQNNGTTIVVHFKDSIGDVSSADVKKILAPVLDFDKHSSTEQYVDSLPPEIKEAIKEKKPAEGMDREQIVMAMGPPVRKTRETNKDDVEEETWQYGEPPGKVTFVVFVDGKIVRIKDSYANLGGTVAITPQSPQ